MSGDAQHKNACSRHFDLLAAGRSPINWRYGAAVRLFQTEPDPKRADCYQDSYQMDWLNRVSDQLYFYCIRREGEDKETRFLSVGYRRDLGVATGAANDFSTAIKLAYEAANGFAMTGVYFRPEFDFRSQAYPTSIMKRLDFLGQKGLLLP